MINSPGDALWHLLDYKCDKFKAGLICVDNYKDNIGQTVIAEGDSSCLLKLKDFFWHAARVKASGLILFFIHKEDTVEPSPSEINIAKRISQGCEAIGICHVDTLIVNKGRVFSFLEHNIDTKNVTPGLFDNWAVEETA
jgi:DNA repair protein RadC